MEKDVSEDLSAYGRFLMALKRARSIIPAHGEFVILLALVSAYCVILSYFTIERMLVLHSSAWDLGNYNQALFTFTHNGLPFYWTSDIPQNPGGSLFGTHFSPILALIAPSYYFLPRPETLLVIQSFIIGLGAIPVWLIARNIVKLSSTRFRLILPSTYLLQPALLGLNWFDFHPEAFIPLLYLSTAYFLMRRNFRWGIGFSILFLSTIEYAPLMLIALTLVLAAPEIAHLAKNRGPPGYGRTLAPWVATIGISLAWLVLSLSVIRLFNPLDPTTTGATSYWTILGANNLLQVPAQTILHPGQAISALVADGTTKFWFLVVLGLPFAFLPFFSPRFWVLASPWLLPALLSNSPGYYNLGLQYPAFLFPALTLVFLGQIKNRWLQPTGPVGQLVSRLVAPLGVLGKTILRVDMKVVLIASSLIGLALSNPFGSLLVATSTWTNYGVPYASAKSVVAGELIALIPPDAAVLTDYNTFPLVSSRPNAYTWPSVIDYPTIPFVQYMQHLTSSSDYILLDLDTFQPYNAVILSFTQNQFGVLGYSNGLLLLQRSYLGAPVLFKPYQQFFTFQQLSLLSGYIADDPASSTGKVLARDGTETNHNFWAGPDVIVPPGEYTVDFRLKVNSSSNGTVLVVRTSAHNIPVRYEVITLGSARYQAFDFSTPNEFSQTIWETSIDSNPLKVGLYQDVIQMIRMNSFSLVEFPGENASSAALSLDRIEVRETKPLSYYDKVILEYQNGTTIPLRSMASPPPSSASDLNGSANGTQGSSVRSSLWNVILSTVGDTFELVMLSYRPSKTDWRMSS